MIDETVKCEAHVVDFANARDVGIAMNASCDCPTQTSKATSGPPAEPARALQRLGDTATRQKGSQARLTTSRRAEHHITVPMHSPLKAGTRLSVLREVAAHFGMTRDELLTELFE